MNKGFTLIESLVAITVFTTVGCTVVGIFISGVQGQKRALASQELSSQTSYVIEYMGRAIRMAQKVDDSFCIANGLNYEWTPTSVKFKNHEGVCQKFYSDGNGNLKEDKGTGASIVTLFLTSGITVNTFNVSVAGDGIESGNQKQPKVTISLSVSKSGATAKVQTTISQRNLDI